VEEAGANLSCSLSDKVDSVWTWIIGWCGLCWTSAAHRLPADWGEAVLPQPTHMIKNNISHSLQLIKIKNETFRLEIKVTPSDLEQQDSVKTGNFILNLKLQPMRWSWNSCCSKTAELIRCVWHPGQSANKSTNFPTCFYSTLQFDRLPGSTRSSASVPVLVLPGLSARQRYVAESGGWTRLTCSEPDGSTARRESGSKLRGRSSRFFCHRMTGVGSPETSQRSRAVSPR